MTFLAMALKEKKNFETDWSLNRTPGGDGTKHDAESFRAIQYWVSR